MTRTLAVAILLISTVALAAQTGNPVERAPTRPCEPQPDCRIVVSPLTPGAPGVGIRDKALIDVSKGPQQQPTNDPVRIQEAPRP